MTKKFFLLLFLFSLIFGVLITRFTYAVDCDGNVPKDPDQLRAYIDTCQSKINSLRTEQQTLKAALNLINSRINLTQAQIKSTTTQIEQLQKDVGSLSIVINDLDKELDQLVTVFVTRVQESYKTRNTNVLTLFFSSKNYTMFQNRLKYLSNAQKRDQLVIHELESARLDFDKQKSVKEQKQQEMQALQSKLQEQTKILGVQSSQKDGLLKETQNSEKKYQDLLNQARAELEAIENIIAGKGKEEKVREVSQNEVIAHIIQGQSCNSGGTHVHFIVAQGSTTYNPFSYLKTTSYENCSGSFCGSSDGDAFNPTGSWDWPIQPKIKFNQGYGRTWAVTNTWAGNIYNFHNGIDINSPSDEVKAVQAGSLYRGSYTGSNGCALKYVRVDHKDSDLDTYYLHVNYY